MKNVVNKSKVIIIALMTMGAAITNPAMATTKADPPAVQVKYLGFHQSNPVFEIVFLSDETDNYLVTIKDKAGDILFSEKLSGKNISRKYRIDTEEEIADGSLRFEVTSLKKKKTEVYVAGVAQTVVKDMAVNRVQ